MTQILKAFFARKEAVVKDTRPQFLVKLWKWKNGLFAEETIMYINVPGTR